MKKLIFLLMVLGLMTISGCQQSQNSNRSTSTQNNVPYSQGPSGPPAVKGPTGAPPSASATSNSPEAVTQDENIKLTLPLKNG